MQKITILGCALLYMLAAPAYAQTINPDSLGPTPQDLENQKLIEQDPVFPSLYRGHVNTIIGDLVNRQCKILPAMESAELHNNVTVAQQKLVPTWLDNHFKLSAVHKLKLQRDAAIIGYGVSQDLAKDCSSAAARESVENAKNDMQCNFKIFLDKSQDTSCYSSKKPN